MSIVFEIPTPGPPPIDIVLRGIKTGLLESRPALPEDGGWPEDTTSLHLPRFSTRATEVSWEPSDIFRVKLFSLARESDTVLALRLVDKDALSARLKRVSGIEDVVRDMVATRIDS